MNIVAADNRTPIVNVLTWFLLTAAVLSVITRLGTKYFIRGRLSPDDYIICVSLLFCALQSICVSVATGNRYGQPIDRMSADQINAVLKPVPVQAVRHHVRQDGRFRLLRAQDLVGADGPAGRLGPDVRVCGRIAVPASADVGLYQSPVFQQGRRWHNRCAPRLLADWTVIVAIVCALVYRNRTIIAPDPMFDTWPVAVCVQVVQSLSIATACSPQFKPFLESLQSSGLRLYELPNRKNRTDSDSRYPRTIGSASMVDRHERALELNLSPQPAATRTVVTAAQQDCDANSQSSQAQIIRETRTWAITEQREQRHSVAGVSDTSAQGIDQMALMYGYEYVMDNAMIPDVYEYNVPSDLKIVKCSYMYSVLSSSSYYSYLIGQPLWELQPGNLVESLEDRHLR
ncbi:hypothetical protein T310_5940 [Rasamsonia emersonii CBS 393.64]|uniref:Integral membrane protein n=1 Tax=Rasamsonia emersonii (strain ATCC 16479 / CBS 393.64 / IMI 116815) TaxID=1408163 RepID=A0A0F4YP63_RASE3|nr:hypothetical protein T310_5940 [Rasamsonia emersonii CBS 393.64]KKA20062.1 hypothetical protein T310_5940 [Rasamsonia emersonii CBS 393.64]